MEVACHSAVLSAKRKTDAGPEGEAMVMYNQHRRENWFNSKKLLLKTVVRLFKTLLA